MKRKTSATLCAILAAALYAVNIPLSKLFLNKAGPTMMAAFLYLGAGIGLLILRLFRKNKENEEKLTKKELPYTIGMIVLDIAAPILLMVGLQHTNSASASLLNNFEIVATSLIAFFVFREVLSKQLIFAIVLVTAASMVLSLEGEGSFQFNSGSLCVLGACCCWGLENNCTRMLSSKSSTEITTIKGLFSGCGSLLIALIAGEDFPDLHIIFLIGLLGFVAYGLSISFYIRAQKELGAAKTSAYYSIAPFLGVFFSMILLREKTGLRFYIGLIIMAAATVFLVRDTISLQHTHPHTHVHTHEHRHGDLVHSHPHSHTHTHTHIHGEDEAFHGEPHEHFADHDEVHPDLTNRC